jgi:preprotein translocase subunit SecD
MNKNLSVKTIVIIGVTLVFLAGIILGPNPAQSITVWKSEGLRAAIQQNIHLGLDLRGGTHLILQVKVDDAVRATTSDNVDQLKSQMRSANIPFAEVSQPDPQGSPDRIVVKGVPTEQRDAFLGIVSDRLPEYTQTSGPDNSYVITMKAGPLQDMKNRAVEQAIETIRNRIDALGVSEPVIEEHGLGQYQILVQLPGVDDPQRVKGIMQSTAMLEIKQVLGGPYSSDAAARQAQQTPGVLPDDAEVIPGTSIGSNSGSSAGQQYWVVTRSSAVTGRDLRSGGARVQTDPNTNQPEVGFTLTNAGGQKFGTFTGAHVGDQLAVVLDNHVREVATIRSKIEDNGSISGGNMTEDAAKDLVLTLNSGALPAGINYLEERTVGPSLGADSIKHGVTAAVIGLLAVLIFMLIYYRGSGINADLALILNLIILLGFMGYFGATLTLPGIAGVILTVGMGVDSNVLIFERIREELRNGKTPPSAVQQGFAHAWITIVDTHVTTIVSAVILFMFGTGPVKGFAVTLTFGLLANLFTAVFVSRVIFDAHLNRHRAGEALSI